jgi:LemA protein
VDTSTIASWVVAAVLLFWCVGAYNRLVRMRHALSRRFATVDQQSDLRHAALQRLADLLAANPASQAAAETLRAACAQAEAARSHARARPSAAGTITSLRLAEDILAEARERIAGDWPAGEEAEALRGELAAADNTLSFARRQFNEAVAQYNRAVGQFPTWLIAGPFGFRSAGLL